MKGLRLQRHFFSYPDTVQKRQEGLHSERIIKIHSGHSNPQQGHHVKETAELIKNMEGRCEKSMQVMYKPKCSSYTDFEVLRAVVLYADVCSRMCILSDSVVKCYEQTIYLKLKLQCI